uniref:Uncharacterized protein n=1 Tax=Tetranychus urticae TaxID=32264 RepID=T1KM35_TETUR
MAKFLNSGKGCNHKRGRAKPTLYIDANIADKVSRITYLELSINSFTADFLDAQRTIEKLTIAMAIKRGNPCTGKGVYVPTPDRNILILDTPVDEEPGHLLEQL